MLMLVEKKPECPPSQDGAPEGFAAPDVAAPPLQNELWLLGQPPLANLLDFVDSAVADPERFDRQALTAAWRRASAQYQALEVSQPGIANAGEHRPLDAALAPLADEVRAHPSFRLSFDTLPTTFAMVDLDHLIVDQQHVTHDFVDAITPRVGPRPDPRTLFRLCMPLEAPAAPVQIQKVGSRRFTFRTRSLDLRFHAAALLDPQLAQAHASFGPVAGIVGLVVGFGCNFLNVVRVGKRVLLANGYHRAVALRAAGIRHVPCVMQEASSVDELQVIVKSRIADAAEFYFESARPPLLADFFDPRLSTLLPIRPRMRQIEVSFEVKDHLVCEGP
ncbi:MAG: hypothetical protein U1F25_20950 [Rubrivivax sp.]